MQAIDFNGTRGVGGAGEHLQGVASGCASDAFVVSADAGGVAVAGDIAVEDNHRYSPVVDLLDDRGYGLGLVGGGDYYVETVVGEIPDVGDLCCVVVVGRSYLHLDILVEHRLAHDLVVHLSSPVILAALRDADAVGLLLAASR